MVSCSSKLIVYEYITRVLNRYVHWMIYILELGHRKNKMLPRKKFSSTQLDLFLAH